MGQVMSKLEAGLIPTVVLRPLWLINLMVVQRILCQPLNPIYFTLSDQAFHLFTILAAVKNYKVLMRRRDARPALTTPSASCKQDEWEAPTVFSAWNIYHSTGAIREAAWKVSCIWKCSIIIPRVQWQVLNAKEVQDWDPHSQGICYFHKAQAILFRFCFALIHWHFTLVVYQLSFFSYGVLWREKLYQLFW